MYNNSMMNGYVVEKLDHKGRGIIRDNGVPIFVENALPDEEVNIKIISEKKGYKEAVVTEYIKKSSNRNQPLCKYYGICGGCDLMHLNYEDQLKFKKNKLIEIMEKFGVETNVKDVLYDKQYNYRNKITLKAINNKVGLYRKKSSELVPIDECLLVDNSINDIINKIHNIDLGSTSDIIIKESNGQTLTNFISKNRKPINIPTTCLYSNSRYVEGLKLLTKNIGHVKYVISPNAFFQVNFECMKILYDKVKEYCNLKGNETIYDLYCGSGTIGIYLADSCKEVIGIEISERSIKDAKVNLKINKLKNMKLVLSDVSKMVNQIKKKPNIIIIDPPRAGLDKITTKWLVTSDAEKIIYVSCDPMTLGRDLKELQINYKITEITPVDMFPNTHHVETVCVLEKLNN